MPDLKKDYFDRIDYVKFLLLLIIKFIFVMLAVIIISDMLSFLCLSFLSLLTILLFNNFYLGNSYFSFNYDTLRRRLVLITFWLTILIIISQQHIPFKSISYKNFLVLVMSLILTFYTRSIFLFYFYFELCLIPIFLNIVG